jgi:hypothetical protein
MTLSETKPIGNFVGSSVSEPFLQGGILISVFAYMVYLQPLMALVAFGVLFPRLRRRLAKINDPWSDLVTWYRDFRMVNERYRLVSGALQTAPMRGNDASNVGELPGVGQNAGHS